MAGIDFEKKPQGVEKIVLACPIRTKKNRKGLQRHLNIRQGFIPCNLYPL
jgi:hypothetical protein